MVDLEDLQRAEEFANSLLNRLQLLEKADYGLHRSQWQQAAGHAKRTRNLLRERIDKHRSTNKEEP